MIKIKFLSNYDGSENLLKRFKANYLIKDSDLAFTIANDYDYAVVFNRTDEPITPKAKVITVIQEPSWSKAHEYIDFLLHSDYVLVHDPELFEKTHNLHIGGDVIISPSYMFYHDHVPHAFFDAAANTKKEKKLSMIVSYLNKPIGNYHKRIGLLNKILDSDLDIDIYGKRLEIEDRRFKGALEYKFSGLLPYEYSIAIENSNEWNYVTEKFVDCALCNTIPIYNGAPNISDIYDERYIRTIDLDSPTILADIKNIIKEPAPLSTRNKDIYFNHYNLYTKLKEIILEKRFG
ncbi:glycosyltransferase family 10 domain-containing protein [Pedobacter cryoconitis]|uniref:Glycosyl transferase family 10 (Putative fucosyltransferase) n=1 Tax=Pedobacter cryoconitis TaxID=188932 RepID=A0A327TBZ6_9SPHI|nr:glycosyltransferase family 10 [Pedobacter cryoconitis]RAJ35427.1 glycosyl transferase family 10 (putative fucosyltransferase) [Pedobacter cryoconitis]